MRRDSGVVMSRYYEKRSRTTSLCVARGETMDRLKPESANSFFLLTIFSVSRFLLQGHVLTVFECGVSKKRVCRNFRAFLKSDN